MRHSEVKILKVIQLSSKTRNDNSMPEYSGNYVHYPGVARENAESVRTWCSMRLWKLLYQVYIHASGWSTWPEKTRGKYFQDIFSIVSEKTDSSFWD